MLTLLVKWICSQLPTDVSREALAVPSAGPASGRCAEARALPRPVCTERALQEGLGRGRWPELSGEIGVEGEPETQLAAGWFLALAFVAI